jgi:hypothetical protein
MAAPSEKGEASGVGKGLGPEPSLDELLRSLNIKGDEIKGLFVAKDEVETLREGAKWMAVIRLLSSRPYSAASLKKTLRFAWAPAQEVKFRDLEEKKFLVQAQCLGDWQRITEQGPWIFRDHGVLVEKHDGSCKASSVELNRIHAWVQIHDVPELYRKKSIIMGLAANVGEVITVDLNGDREDGGNYVRARVWLDVRNCLTRFVSITPEGMPPVIMQVKYEKVPCYCGVCGLMGHVKEECGTGVHPPESVVFGKWMLADTPWNRSQLQGEDNSQRQNQAPRREPRFSRNADAGGSAGRGGRGGPGRDGGRDGGRNGGRGRVADQDGDTRKRSSTDADLTEVSPIKPGQPPLLLTWKEPGVIVPSPTDVKKQLVFAEAEQRTYEAPVGTPSPPPSARELKRSKKGNPMPKKNKGTTEAAGSEELRREQ